MVKEKDCFSQDSAALSTLLLQLLHHGCSPPHPTQRLPSALKTLLPAERQGFPHRNEICLEDLFFLQTSQMIFKSFLLLLLLLITCFKEGSRLGGSDLFTDAEII